MNIGLVLGPGLLPKRIYLPAINVFGSGSRLHVWGIVQTNPQTDRQLQEEQAMASTDHHNAVNSTS